MAKPLNNLHISVSESSGASQAGAAAPDVEHTKVYNTKVDDLGVPMAAPDVERLIERLRQIADTYDGPLVPSTCREAADALSAAHTREAEREAIFEAVVDALEGRNVSDFMESFPAVRLALDARAREAALRAENERLKEMERQLWWPKTLLDRAEAAEAHVARLEAALKLARTYIREIRDRADDYLARNPMGAIKAEADSVLPDIEIALDPTSTP